MTEKGLEKQCNGLTDRQTEKTDGEKIYTLLAFFKIMDILFSSSVHGNDILVQIHKSFEMIFR